MVGTARLAGNSQRARDRRGPVRNPGRVYHRSPSSAAGWFHSPGRQSLLKFAAGKRLPSPAFHAAPASRYRRSAPRSARETVHLADDGFMPSATFRSRQSFRDHSLAGATELARSRSWRPMRRPVAK